MAHAISLPEHAEVIRIVAIDSTRMNSQLLASALERDKRFQVLEAAVELRAIAALVTRDKPAVVIVSAELENQPRKGFEIVRELHGVCPETRIIMLLDA